MLKKKKWINSWKSVPDYFSKIPLLNSNKTATFLITPKYKKLNKKLDISKLKKNLLEILFNLDSRDPVKLRWIYIKNKIKSNKIDNTWDSIFNRFSNIIKNDDYLWIGAKYSKEIPLK